jgi:uncharacterized membrane protein YqaE (UPF0057 family)
MRYLLALVLPPLAMLTCGKPVEAVICLLLQVTVLGWIPASIWAVLTVSSHAADRRNREIVRALRERP